MQLRRRLIAIIASSAALCGTAVVPAAHAADRLDWGPCPVGSHTAERAQCATITVPKDYANPGAGTIELTMSKLPATGTRKGVLAGNPGGPGGDALGMFSDSTPQDGVSSQVQLPDDVRDSYDIIALEPRGLAWGTPLECFPDPTNPASLLSVGNAFELCESHNPGYTRTITTENTARDLNEARKALGEDRLNLYGVSYGGFLMSTYATLFPEHTNKMVLDSSVSPKDTWFALGAHRKGIRQEAISAFFEWAARNHATYHLGTTPRAVYQTFNRVIRDNLGVNLPVAPRGATPEDLGATGSAGLDALTAGAADNEDYAAAAVQLIDAVDQLTWRAAVFGDRVSSYPNILRYLSILQAPAPLTLAMYSEEAWPEVAQAFSESAATTPAGPLTFEGEIDPASLTPEEQEAIQRQAMALQAVDKAVVCNENSTPADLTRIIPLWETKLTGGDRISMNEDMLASGQHCTGWPLPTPARAISGAQPGTAPLNLGFDKDTAVTPHGASDTQAAMGGDIHLFQGYSHGVLINKAGSAAPLVSEYLR